MTESDQIEEILYEAHSYGMRVEVMEWAKKEMLENPKMSKIDAYNHGFNEWCK